MRVLIILQLILMATATSFAQNAPINFEAGGNGANWTWAVFENATNPPLEIIANPDPSGINTSATVAKFTALAGGNPWAGTESMHGADLGAFVLSPSNSIIKIMVWKSVISDVGIKFASPAGWAQVEIKRPNTVVNQWEELTFDFSSYLNPPADQGQLDQIIVFPDFNLAGRGQDNIIYFDNITFNSNIVNTDEAEALRNMVRVYPNPVASGERIQFSREVTQIEVFDLAGKRIVAGSGYSLHTAVLKPGVYVMKMLTQDGSIQTQKLVVQ